jgi:uncharacterized RDD family membrane protein YckC
MPAIDVVRLNQFMVFLPKAASVGDLVLSTSVSSAFIRLAPAPLVDRGQ